MPLYEYKCTACGQLFERMQKFSDAPLTVHESCGGPLERLVSAPALQFKGSGWYITDYARKNGGSKISGDDGHSKDKPAADKPAAPAAKSETKPESKPAAPAKS